MALILVNELELGEARRGGIEQADTKLRARGFT